MPLFNKCILLILILALLSRAVPHNGSREPDKSTAINSVDVSPVTPLAATRTPQCGIEGWCALVTYDYSKQVEIGKTPCYDFKEGTVTGVLVANCRCYLFFNYSCTGVTWKGEKCPGLLREPNPAPKSIRCEGL